MFFKAIRFKKRKVIAFGVITVFLLCTANYIGPAAVTVFNSTIAQNKRKLPIYCVDTTEKKIAISFDAA